MKDPEDKEPGLEDYLDMIKALLAIIIFLLAFIGAVYMVQKGYFKK